MTESALECSKCRAAMEEGFIVDHGHYEMPRPSGWVEGAPVESFWSGTKIEDKRTYQVKTFRCIGCGYLESYATAEKETDSTVSSLFT